MLHEMGIETGIELDRLVAARARGAGRARPPARLARAHGRAGRVALDAERGSLLPSGGARRLSLPGGERRIGRREGDRVIDLGPGASMLRRRGRRRERTHPLDDVTLHLPFAVADYVDFYSSLHHATNVGRMFRPDADPLPPNWRHLPSATTAAPAPSSPSGTPIARPHGQRRARRASARRSASTSSSSSAS